jgi:cytochrome c oxidase subunit 2
MGGDDAADGRHRRRLRLGGNGRREARRRLSPGLAALILIAVNLKGRGALPYVSRQGSARRNKSRSRPNNGRGRSHRPRSRSGRPVEFHVTSKDVNHGFAIYDQGLRIVAQTQAMPNYVNILRYTFPASGTYRVLCLESCGLAHHMMAAEITAIAR